jgi:hypothetical protein
VQGSNQKSSEAQRQAERTNARVQEPPAPADFRGLGSIAEPSSQLPRA